MPFISLTISQINMLIVDMEMYMLHMDHPEHEKALTRIIHKLRRAKQ